MFFFLHWCLTSEIPQFFGHLWLVRDLIPSLFLSLFSALNKISLSSSLFNSGLLSCQAKKGFLQFWWICGSTIQTNFFINTSLTAPGVLTHGLQNCTAFKIINCHQDPKNGLRGLESGWAQGFWHSHLLAQNMFFDPSTSSLRKLEDRGGKNGGKHGGGERKILTETLLLHSYQSTA